MSKAHVFPKEMFVTKDENVDDNDNNLLAWLTAAAGIEDEGPTYVAVYQLVHVKKFSKQVVES